VGASFFAPVQTGPGAYPASCTMGTESFPEVKSGQGRDTDPSPPSSVVGQERVELYLYSPYGLYGLYRASVPVQGCTLLLPYSVNCHTAEYAAGASSQTLSPVPSESTADLVLQNS
jgi:hypothetical protein